MILGCQPRSRDDAAAFPSKPIKVVVYTKPGGLIDTTARKFTDIASKLREDATFVVENTPGAGGIVLIINQGSDETVFAAARFIDANDVRTQMPQQRRTVRPGDVSREIDHANIAEDIGYGRIRMFRCGCLFGVCHNDWLGC